MDETEARRLLTDAADEIGPSPDLAARAWGRFRHRRQVRRRASVAAAVVSLVAGVGVVAATLSSNEPQPRITSPAPTSSPVTTVPSTSTTVAPPPGPVDPATLQSPSFVNANTGYAVEAGNMVGLVRSDDGGRTWQRVGSLPDGKGSVYFASASDGIAWGSGPLFATRDGGLHWSLPPDAPTDSFVSAIGETVWALAPCVQVYPCTPHVTRSNDGGQTWNPTARLEPGFGTSSITAISRDVAFVLMPVGNTNDQNSAHPIDLAVTRNGGNAWTTTTTPCQSFGGAGALLLASNGRTLVLICTRVAGAGGEVLDEYSSNDNGVSWTTLRIGPSQGGYSSVLVSIDGTYVLGATRGSITYSTDNGATWQVGIDTGEAYPSIGTTPGVGVFVATGRSGQNAGIWFSADGVHWEQRS